MATATLLNPTQLEDHIETDLSQNALQRILDAEETEIIQRYGAHSSGTTTEMLPGGFPMLVLQRTPSSITSVTEVVGDDSTVLAADDYRDWLDGRLERLDDGTNQRTTWGDRVTVVYTAEDMDDQRRLVLVQLCKLAIEYTGLGSEAIGSGDYRSDSLEYNAERERLLASLSPRGLWFA